AAVWYLARADESYRPEAEGLLFEMAASEVAPVVDRCSAVDHLMSLKPAAWRQLVQLLTEILVFPFTKPLDRLSIIDLLVRTNSISRYERVNAVLAVAQD